MTRRFWIAAGLIAALTGGSVAASAQGPRGGPGIPGPRPGMRGAQGLDLGLRGVTLTEAQREQVRAIMDVHRAQRQDVQRRLREAHRAFAEAARAATPDEAAVRARSAEVASAMADAALLRAKMRAEVHALLTPEQQEHIQRREAEMQKRRQARETRLQQRLEERKKNLERRRRPQ